MNPIWLLLGLVACAPDYTDAPVKMVGVGYDPESIGPAPTPYGGVIEYSHVTFAGGGLSLALLQLGSFDEVGPSLAGAPPPYDAVYGSAFLFDSRISGAESLGSLTASPPEAEETCYTTFEASGPIGSFTTVDVGNKIQLWNEERTAGLLMDRSPGDYPANAQDVFVYYMGVDAYQAQPLYGRVPGASNLPSDMTSVLLKPSNFPFGQTMTLSFPGALPPAEAPISSIPLPSGAVGTDPQITLPSALGGVQMEWTGPRYDAYGNILEAGDDWRSSCLQYYYNPIVVVNEETEETAPFVPRGADECQRVLAANETGIGQVYTGPWDTKDGKVIFRWSPTESANEVVSISVRFLGKLDREDPSFQERVIKVAPNQASERAWNRAQVGTPGNLATIPQDYPMPEEGRRAAQACEDESDGASWEFDDAYLLESGEYIPSLRGDPFHNLSEVTCRMADDGYFELTNEIVEDALTYARAHGAEGVVFYFSRSTSEEINVPDAKDAYNQRREISPVKLTSRSIEIGRFWLEDK